MPKNYKLTYFNGRGRAEPVRLMFAYKGVQYEDKRVEKDEWQTLKQEMPCQQLPVLEVDGQKLPQSIAIGRYVGNELGLVGKNNWENARLDASVDCLEDLWKEVTRWYMAEDPQKKQQIEQELKDKTIPDKLRCLESFINLGKNKFILGDKPVWADFFVANMLQFLGKTFYGGQTCQGNKNLADYMDRVLELPGVKEWIAKRPNTPM